MLRQEYLPAGPSESSRIRDFAAQQIKHIRESGQLQDKANFMKYLQELTNDMVGVHKKEPIPPRAPLSIESYSSPPAAPIAPVYLTPELRQPSMHQLDKMRSIRQNMQHQSGIHFAPPPPSKNLSTTIDYPPFKPPATETVYDYRRPLSEVAFPPPANSSSSQLKYVPSSGDDTLVGDRAAEVPLPAPYSKVQISPEISVAPAAAIPVSNTSAISKTIYDSNSSSSDEEEESEAEDEDDEQSVIEIDTSLTVPPPAPLVNQTVPSDVPTNTVPPPTAPPEANSAPAPPVRNFGAGRFMTAAEKAKFNEKSQAPAAPVVNPTIPSVPVPSEAAPTAVPSVAVSTSSAPEAAAAETAAALYAKKLEQLLAERDQEILSLRTSQLKALEAQLLQPAPASLVAAAATAPPPPASLPENKAPSPQQQHIHIHNHFASTGGVDSTTSSSSGKTEAKAASSSTDSGKENNGRLNSTVNEPSADRYQYPYEMPYYAPRPQKPASTIAAVPAATSHPNQDVEVIFGSSRTASVPAPSGGSSNLNTVNNNKGSTLVERALDLSGLTLERLRELTGRY